MDHWSQDGAGNQKIPLENMGRKDSSTYIDVGEANENDAKLAVSRTSEAIIVTDRRSLRLEGNRKRDKKKEKKEKVERPKIALNRDRAGAVLHFALFHAMPVGGAIALIVLNTKTHYYGIDGTGVSAFQFVAKAHEILMQASIITVMVAYLQYLLTHERAVPFGAIFSAYRITDMSYLWSHEFRAALTTSSFPRCMKIAFLVFILFSILLAAAIGPSSAIAMQPRLVNLTVPDLRVAFDTTSDILYPNSFDEAGPPLNFSDVYRNELSPAAGWEYLQNLPPMDSNTEIGLQPKRGQPAGIWKYVMPELYSAQLTTHIPYEDKINLNQGRSITRTLYVQYASNSTFATVQRIPIAVALTPASYDLRKNLNYRPGVSVISAKTPQAWASAFCKLHSIANESDTRPIQFPDAYVAGYGDEKERRSDYGHDSPPKLWNWPGVTNYTAITRRQIWDQAREYPQGRIIWADDIQVSRPVAGAALGAIVIHPEFCGANYTFLTASACVVGARWANTTSYLGESYNGDFVLPGSAIENAISPHSPGTLPLWSQPSVKLSKVWAESLNPISDIQNRTVADNLLRSLPLTSHLCSKNDADADTLRPFIHERLIAFLVANGMSHAAGAVKYWAHPGSNEHVRPLVLTFQGRLPGYAWNLDGTPIKVAMSILSLYCVYALLYVSYTFVTGRSSMAWRSISGLMALAMNSAPTEALEHTSAGIERTNTFRKLVSVREVEEDGRLEIVFKQDEEKRGPYKRVAVGRTY